MSDSIITVHLNTDEIKNTFNRIQATTNDLTPLMNSIRQALLYNTELNFESQGRPRWPSLSGTTKKIRADKRKWPGQILQVTGALARSLVGKADASSAIVGVGKELPYAAIHQFGGKAGRGKKVIIPARPYLPVVENQLQADAEVAIVELANDYLTKITRSK